MQNQSIYTGKQQLVIEKTENDVALFLDGELQFITSENFIYDSAMVDIPLSMLNKKSNLNVLILGGGDGLIANKLLTYNIIKHITICEFDEEVINICKTNPEIQIMNNGALTHKKVSIVIMDAYEFVQKNSGNYDIIIADFPDVHIKVISRLFSSEFYTNTAKLLVNDGIFVTIGCEINYTRRCYDCIGNTLASVFPCIRGYFVSMPKSYGDIGIYIASQKSIKTKIENEIFERSTENINTSENNIAFYLFDEDTKKTGFIPGLTNR